MEQGIVKISIERDSQFLKHGYSIESDLKNNNAHQLSKAASILCVHESDYGCLEIEYFIEDHCPDGWDKKRWEYMLRKPFLERLVIAGSLLAAQIDVEQFKK